jgi:hypothetical protein
VCGLLEAGKSIPPLLGELRNRFSFQAPRPILAPFACGDFISMHLAINPNPLTKSELLNARRLPARLMSEEAAVLLGLPAHSIAILIEKKFLRPLGKPRPNAPKFFATVDVLSLSADQNWLSDVTRVLSDHWRKKRTIKVHEVHAESGGLVAG